MPSRIVSLPRTLAALALLPRLAFSQIADSEPAVVAGIPVNYTEAKAGAY